MKEERNNGMKPLEGAALFTTDKDKGAVINPTAMEDGLYIFPENEKDSDAGSEKGSSAEVKAGKDPQPEKIDPEKEQYKVGGPLTVDLSGNQMDTYSKEKKSN